METQKCAECGCDNIYQDTIRGDYVCSECGLVQGQIISADLKATERAFANADTNVTHHYRAQEPVDHPLCSSLGTTFAPTNNPLFERLQWHQKASRPRRVSSRKNTASSEVALSVARCDLNHHSSSSSEQVPDDAPELVSDGVFLNDFVKMCDHFHIPLIIKNTGILVIEKLLKTQTQGKNEAPKVLKTCSVCHKTNVAGLTECECGTPLSEFASRGDQRSMNSIRTSRRWASALFYYILQAFRTRYAQLTRIQKKEISDYALVRISKLNGHIKKIRNYEYLFTKFLAKELLEHKSTKPSELVCDFIQDDFSQEVVQATKTVLELVEDHTYGRSIHSQIAASLYYAHQLLNLDVENLDDEIRNLTKVTLGKSVV